MPSASIPSSDAFRQILGIRFYVGPLDGLLERTRQGGLIVVPSAPVLANLTADPAHRQALEAGDLAITDSGFMVFLWRAFKRERLIRISGLRYLRALLDLPDFRQPGATFWVMPTAVDARGNCAWLDQQGLAVTENDCYIAPMYSSKGPLDDRALLTLLEARRPLFVMINLGGGVQERLGYYLRTHLTYRPALICTGAAIAFLSNRQVNIPPWADRMALGWLLRTLSEPAKFIPRYGRSLRLVPLLWKHGSRSVAS
jgi:N-acetylglucosaminyldiphosphoundecaprenol N-acetyl-beta-D-mannosaminyltransferase